MALELWPEFTGGSYSRNNLYVDSERLINLYPETSGRGEHNRTPMRLMSTPGLTLLTDLSTLNANITGPIYDLITVTTVSGGGAQRTYALVGGTPSSGIFLVEYRGAAPPVVIGAPLPILGNPVGSLQQPKLVSCGQDQILLINGNPSAGAVLATGAVYNIATGTVNTMFSAFTPGWLGAADADFLDGYVVAAQPNSQTFFISGLQDALNYDPLDIAVENDAPDTVVAIRVIHRDVFVFGKSRILVWNDTGAAAFPFSRNNSATIEVGCLGPRTVVKLNDTLFWLGRDQRGGIQAWKMQGYNALRISTPAIEAEWQNFYFTAAFPESNLFNVQCYAYQEEGHQFYVINFPNTAAAAGGFTRVFDDTEGLWHERQSMQDDNTYSGCCLPRCHTFSPLYGHIVGSRTSAKLYYQDRTEGKEEGKSILRVRSAPHLYQGSKRNYYKQMVLDINPYGQTFDITMQYTHNAGQTFSATTAPAVTDRGSGKRIAWNRLGSGSDFFVNVFVKGTGQFSISGAYLDLSAGTN
jgi:hypothetical protein